MAKAPNEVITESKHEIFHQIDSSSNRFVEQLRVLCRQPSVSAQNLGLDETAELVSKFLKETGFTVEQFSPSKGPPVVGRLSSTTITMCSLSSRLSCGRIRRSRRPSRMAESTPGERATTRETSSLD